MRAVSRIGSQFRALDHRRGGHAGVDPILVAGEALVGRALDPANAAVVGITRIRAGDLYPPTKICHATLA